jgi:uncharacterized membrane protein
MRRQHLEKTVTIEALSTAPAPFAKARRRPPALVPYWQLVRRFALIGLGLLAVFMVPAILSGKVTRVPVPHWPNLSLIVHAPVVIQAHLYTIIGAIAVGGILLAGVKGSMAHRILGSAWCVFMLGTAIIALFIPPAPGLPHIGPLGPIHLFSVLVLIQVPRAVIKARQHKAAEHGRAMTGVLLGGLMLAGVFAFIPGRLMFQVFFG